MDSWTSEIKWFFVTKYIKYILNNVFGQDDKRIIPNKEISFKWWFVLMYINYEIFSL